MEESTYYNSHLSEMTIRHTADLTSKSRSALKLHCQVVVGTVYTTASTRVVFRAAVCRRGDKFTA